MRSIASVGLSNTDSYTIASWLLLDVALVMLAPANPDWTSEEEAWSNFQISDYKRFLEAYAAAPESYNNFEIMVEVWKAVLFFNRPTPYIGPFFDTHLILINEFDVSWHYANAIWNLFTYPTTRTEDQITRKGVLCDDDRADCADERWLLGQNYDKYITFPLYMEKAEGNRWTVPVPTGNIEGTDLGISVTLGEKIYFYFGDTWGCGSLNDCISQDLVGAEAYSLPTSSEPVPYSTSPTLYLQNPANCNGDLNCMHGRSSVICNDAVTYASRPDSNNVDQNWSGALADLFLTMPQTRLVDDCADYDLETCLGYTPLVIEGVNKRLAEPPSPSDLLTQIRQEFGVFNTPTGAGKMMIDGVETIVLWYASAGALSGVPADVEHSWLACSTDGTNFSRCPGFEHDYFSDETVAKFLNVAPIRLSGEEIDTLCNSTPSSSTMCSLRRALGEETAGIDGLLLFGSGAPYRCSGLYLGFMYQPPQTPGADLEVLYFDGSDEPWKTTQADAIPILAPPEACESVVARPFVAYWNPSKPTTAFGELSVEKITVGATTYLVMLSNHNSFANVLDEGAESCLENGALHNVDNCLMDTPIQMRMTRLGEPETWRGPKSTASDGYGPYFIRDYSRFISSDDPINDPLNVTLKMAHVLSSWKGGSTMKNNQLAEATTCWGGASTNANPDGDVAGKYQDEPYGVFVRPLELDDGSGGHRPRLDEFF